MSKRKVHTVYDGETEKAKLDLRKILIAAIVVLSAAALILLTVFSVKYFGTHHLVSDAGGGTLTDRRTGVTYKAVVICPYTVNVALDEVYAECDGVNYYKIAYQDIDGKEKLYDPEKMIAAVDEFKNVDLYLAQDFTLPAFDALAPTQFSAYRVEVESQKIGKFGKTDTQTLINVLKTGENTAYPVDVDGDSYLQLHMFDPAYPYFWYTVEYFETMSGDKYVRDKAQNKCIKANDDLSKIFGSTSEAETG